MSDVTLPTTLDRIIWNDGSARIGGIEVDGRLLVDGPANTSQVWSNYFSGTALNNPENALMEHHLKQQLLQERLIFLWTVPGGLDYTTSVEVAELETRPYVSGV